MGEKASRVPLAAASGTVSRKSLHNLGLRDGRVWRRAGPLAREEGEGTTAGRGGHDGSWPGRVTPSFFMRLRRVLAWRPRTRAAPAGPSMTPLVWRRMTRMCSRSTSSRVGACPEAGAR